MGQVTEEPGPFLREMCLLGTRPSRGAADWHARPVAGAIGGRRLGLHSSGRDAPPTGPRLFRGRLSRPAPNVTNSRVLLGQRHSIGVQFETVRKRGKSEALRAFGEPVGAALHRDGRRRRRHHRAPGRDQAVARLAHPRWSSVGGRGPSGPRPSSCRRFFRAARARSSEDSPYGGYAAAPGSVGCVPSQASGGLEPPPPMWGTRGGGELVVQPAARRREGR